MLYCDEKMEARVLIQTTSGVGGWFGLIFASLVSDRFGRKLSFSLGLALLSFGTCISTSLSILVQFIGIIYGSPGLLALS
jgi:MFS family permease